jgi:prevent-host-death family protein
VGSTPGNLTARRSNLIIRLVTEITATDASKRFADMLDAVEHRGESFTVVRRGRAIAVVTPAQPSTLGQLRGFVRSHRPDPDWERDQAEIRRDSGPAPAQDPWPD